MFSGVLTLSNCFPESEESNALAVLIEFISVVVRRQAFMEDAGYGYGISQKRLQNFADLIPNETFCDDGRLMRVGFMDPSSTQDFIRSLEAVKLRYIVNGRAQDLIVVDQIKGFMSPCDWAITGQVCVNGDPEKPVRSCAELGASLEPVAVPDGWEYAKSWTFIPKLGAGK
jgi:hypothetical protein